MLCFPYLDFKSYHIIIGLSGIRNRLRHERSDILVCNTSHHVTTRHFLVFCGIKNRLRYERRVLVCNSTSHVTTCRILIFRGSVSFGSIDTSSNGSFNLSIRSKESLADTEAFSSSPARSTRTGFCVLLGVTVAAVMFATETSEGAEGVVKDSRFCCSDSLCLESQLSADEFLSSVVVDGAMVKTEARGRCIVVVVGFVDR
mmetsp:Transcript_42303/g.47780  ORF Transcript_42303/g.47780 Transcript_42303/m.47780 type:complete len:201 (+) Transcript_42303:286-888(+)